VFDVEDTSVAADSTCTSTEADTGAVNRDVDSVNGHGMYAKPLQLQPSVLTRQFSDPAITDCAVEAAILQNWRCNMNVPLSVGEDDDDVDAGGDTDGDLGEFSWDLLEADSGLSAWDQLGE
jgi:hypothetical protein